MEVLAVWWTELGAGTKECYGVFSQLYATQVLKKYKYTHKLCLKKEEGPRS